MHLIRAFSHKPIECLLLLLWFLPCILSHTNYMYSRIGQLIEVKHVEHHHPSKRTKTLNKIFFSRWIFLRVIWKMFLFFESKFCLSYWYLTFSVMSYHRHPACFLPIILFLTENCTPTQKHGRTLSQNSLFHFFNLCVSLSPSLCR